MALCDIFPNVTRDSVFTRVAPTQQPTKKVPFFAKLKDLSVCIHTLLKVYLNSVKVLNWCKIYFYESMKTKPRKKAGWKIPVKNGRNNLVRRIDLHTAHIKTRQKTHLTMAADSFVVSAAFFYHGTKKQRIVRSPSTRAIEQCTWVRLNRRTHKAISKNTTAVDFAVAIFVSSSRKSSARTQQSTARLIFVCKIDRRRFIVASVDFRLKNRPSWSDLIVDFVVKNSWKFQCRYGASTKKVYFCYCTVPLHVTKWPTYTRTYSITDDQRKSVKGAYPSWSCRLQSSFLTCCDLGTIALIIKISEGKPCIEYT